MIHVASPEFDDISNTALRVRGSCWTSVRPDRFLRATIQGMFDGDLCNEQSARFCLCVCPGPLREGSGWAIHGVPLYTPKECRCSPLTFASYVSPTRGSGRPLALCHSIGSSLPEGVRIAIPGCAPQLPLDDDVFFRPARIWKMRFEEFLTSTLLIILSDVRCILPLNYSVASLG